jgi:AcrR family transcriptional regulator
MNIRSAIKSKENILKTALRLFSDCGYKGTSMRMIADGAGISVGGIYLYFRSKEDIYVTLMRGILDDLSRESEQKVDSILAPVDALKALITLRLDYARKHRELILTQIKEQGFTYGLELKKKFFRQQRALIERIIGRGMEAGDFASCNITEVAKVIMGTLRGYILTLVVDPEDLFAPEQCSRLLLDGLMARSDAGPLDRVESNRSHGARKGKGR